VCFQQDFEENMSADRPGSQLGFSGNQVLPQDYSEAFRENIPKEGLWTTWHENGQKRAEIIRKDGKKGPDGAVDEAAMSRSGLNLCNPSLSWPSEAE
jgi:hypothetical protein